MATGKIPNQMAHLSLTLEENSLEKGDVKRSGRNRSLAKKCCLWPPSGEINICTTSVQVHEHVNMVYVITVLF